MTAAKYGIIKADAPQVHAAARRPPHLRARALTPELVLLSRLQTSLDPAEVLRMYFEELGAWLGLSGLDWRDGHGEMRFGRRARCRHVYRVSIGQEFLGELTAMRREALSEPERAVLEQSTGLLIYPLRNALLYQQVFRAARQDALTGLGNRAALDAGLRRELDLAHRHGEPLTIILLDIDRFKSINDSYGHLAGDQVIAQLAALLTQAARASDLLFRYAGDEFIVLMARTALEGAITAAHRLREQVDAAGFIYKQQRLPVRISLGVALAADHETPESLFERADKALLAAKRGGRDRVKVAG